MSGIVIEIAVISQGSIYTVCVNVKVGTEGWSVRVAVNVKS